MRKREKRIGQADYTFRQFCIFKFTEQRIGRARTVSLLPNFDNRRGGLKPQNKNTVHSSLINVQQNKNHNEHPETVASETHEINAQREITEPYKN